MPNRLLIFSFIVAILSISCGAKKWGTPVGMQINYSETDNVNYGHSFRVQTILVYSTGKTKDITKEKETTYKIQGGKINGNRVSVPGYQKSFGENKVKLEASYTKKDVHYSLSATFPYNYKGDLIIKRNGANGHVGSEGEKGKGNMLFRNGTDGQDGGNGSDGADGHDLTLHIYKDTINDIFKIKVTDVSTTNVFYYKNKDMGFPIKIFSNGGHGGAGGNGADGKDGKDGRMKEDKEKFPGDGGNGGNGGDAGSGGTGGSIYIFIHPSASGIENRIVSYANAGNAGIGGKGGLAGEAGKPLEGQDGAKNGTAGTLGQIGLMGNPGPPLQMSVEDFDIDF